ncbi:MAG: universal stress protein [bacterium]
MIGKMLVVLDDSEHSLHGLKEALALARSEKSRIELVAVVPPFDGDLRIMGKKGILADQQAAFEAVLEKGLAISKSFGIAAKSVLLEGEPFEQILFRAEESNVDLIVITKKNPYPMDLIPIGAVATRVIGQGEKDVLIISKDSCLTLEKIVLAYDNSENAIKAAQKAFEMALAYGSELLVATVFEVPLEGFALSPEIWNKIGNEARQIQAAVVEKAREMGVRKIETAVRHGSTYQELIKLAREVHAGIIMMGAKKKSGMFKFRLGNVMERVISNGSIPVWVANS